MSLKEREIRIQQAINDLREDLNLSQAQAAAKNGVAKSTPSGRLNSRRSRVNTRYTNVKLTV